MSSQLLRLKVFWGEPTLDALSPFNPFSEMWQKKRKKNSWINPIISNILPEVLNLPCVIPIEAYARGVVGCMGMQFFRSS